MVWVKFALRLSLCFDLAFHRRISDDETILMPISIIAPNTDD